MCTQSPKLKKIILDKDTDNIFSGIAYMGTMCKKSSLSVVEAKPNQHAVLTAAHELGHR